MMASPVDTISIEKSVEYSFLDNFLYYGLLIGAFFQLACIFAVVFIPKSEAEKEADHEVPEPQQTGTPRHDQHSSRRSNKHERKKRR